MNCATSSGAWLNGRRWLVVVLVALALLAIGASVWIASSQQEEGIRQTIARLEAKAELAFREREAPYGETLPGDAWVSYRRALARHPSKHKVHSLLQDFLAGGQSSEDRDQLLLLTAGSRAEIGRGARARKGSLCAGWREAEGALIEWGKGSYLGTAMVAEMQRLLEDGQPGEAVRRMLEAQQFAADLATSGLRENESLGLGLLVPNGLKRLLETESFALLSKSSKLAWVDGLRRIEETVPVASQAMRGELSTTASEILDAMEEGRFLVHSHNWWQRWRPKVVYRGMVAELLLEGERVAAQLDAAYGLPRAQIVAEITRIVLDPRVLGASKTMGIAPLQATLAEQRVESIARLEFLRHALALDLDVPDVAPESPYATALRVEQLGGRTRVWCEHGSHTTSLPSVRRGLPAVTRPQMVEVIVGVE